MTTLLIDRVAHLATMDDAHTEISDAALLVRNGFIAWLGPRTELPAPLRDQATQTIDASHCVAIPGLVNTHHHMYQTLTRALPAVQDAELFAWLRGLYPVWARLTPDGAFISAQVAMAELLLSGCTTSSDHLYLYPNGVRLDDTIAAAQAMGLRFVATRGSMSVGQSAGGLPPDALVEDEAHILADSQRVVQQFHDAAPGAMVQVALAPCSPFSVSPQLMRDSAALARSLGVRLHTHLAENDHDVAYCRQHFGMTPAQYAESLGWVGPDVWHAHCVKLDDEGVALFGRTRTGVAHCPCSNARLASGLAPIRALINAGAKVGLGVDGSASNDGADLLAEARQALLMARLRRSVTEPFGCDAGPSNMTARQALSIATRGGAAAFGRSHDIGQLKVGHCADIAIYRTDSLGLAGGAVHDPVAALLLCAPPRAHTVLVGGQVRVQGGELVGVDLPLLIERHNALARAMAQPA